MAATSKKNKSISLDNTQLKAASSADRSRSPAQLLVAPWPEWNDAEINAEKWETGTSHSGPIEIMHRASLSVASPIGFENPIGRICLPASVVAHEWRRALSINPFFEMLPEDVAMPVLDFTSSNGHILHSEVMRHIVTSITNLHHFAAIKPFDEVESDNYVPNGGRVWRPWNHVYAMCKVGKGTQHKPTINKAGKYIVRLYYLGKWRRITVDDILPLDEFGRIILPMTTKNELWPILLSKAILRVAALTWTYNSEVVEMHAVSCFTGWFMLNIECQRVPAKELWLVCQKALMNDAEEGARYKEERKQTDAYQLGTRLNTGGGDFMSSLSLAAFNEIEEGWGAVAVFANMCDLDEVLDDEMEEVGPCVGHQVHFSEARVIRVGDDGGELPLWKTFRWKRWALKMGIIQPDHLVNVKSLRLFAPLKKWVVPSPQSATSIFTEMARLKALEEEQVQELQVLEAEKGKGKKKDKKTSGKKSSNKSAKSKSAKSKSGSKGSSKKKTVAEPVKPLENTDPWMNFNVFSQYVTSLQLFFRASSFKCCKSAHDFRTFLKAAAPKEVPEKSTKKKKAPPKKTLPAAVASQQQNLAVSTTKQRMFRDRDYFYLACDSPTAKKLFFTVEIVPPSGAREQNTYINTPVDDEGSSCSVIIKDFTQTLKPVTALCRLDIVTAGVKSRILPLREGLVILRIWVDLPRHSFLQIVSQTEFKVGSIEMVNELTSKPSTSLALYGSRIHSAFTRLAGCEAGSPEHVLALEAFHSSYLPDNMETFLVTSRNVSKLTALLREKCEEACAVLLFDRLKDDFDRFYKALKELQVLMMAPEFGLRTLARIAPDLYDKIMDIEHPVILTPESSGLELELLENLPEAGDSLKETSKKKGVGKGKKKEKEKEKDKGKKGKGKGQDMEKGDMQLAKKSAGKGGKKEKNNSKKSKSDKSSKSNTAPGGKKAAKKPHELFADQATSGVTFMTKMIDINPDAVKYYPFRDDLKQVTVCKDYTGMAPVSAFGDWFPIVRLVVNLDEGANENSKNSIFLFCSAALCYFQITNNDKLKNRQTTVGPICRSVFTRNTFGYTILAYGYCDNVNVKEHSFKIQIVAHRYEDLLHTCLGQDPATGACITAPAPRLKVKHVYGHYIPNRRNTVLRCVLTVHCSQVLTIRVSMSDLQAAILVKVLRDATEDEGVRLLYEKSFTGRVVLPSLPFVVEVAEEDEEQKPEVFLIEAELAHAEGWLLSEDQRELVTSLKEKLQRDLLVFASQPDVGLVADVPNGAYGQQKRLPKSQEIIPQAAYWCVQVVLDEALDSQVELEMNTRKAQEIRKLKEAWEATEPGRHVRASAARQKILDERDEETRRSGVSFAKSPGFQSFQLKESGFSPSQLSEWKIVAEEYGEEQEAIRSKEREEYDIMLKEISEKMANICEDQKKTNEMIGRHMSENEAASKALLENGYKMREASRVKPDAKVAAKGKKDKKGDKAKGGSAKGGTAKGKKK